ncbi:MAG: TraB/GumN family protein [Pseudotabrizicola sp.]|uniref:TraB/GumN family protein n=1 Tax=Pseudotabrizicola sp. TaxID=2939647 RepID=UPI002727F201|nr:TraB/GumN family protein [Pseudotabrizicola sp.]MDO8884504.1 TraB/GumN family protein [Pseudotabrizicola sp.]MDP2080097.1 TraB/GumN family protein [Pseudotabrizicola sp.]MDZ7575543.1 TraB/GumN family protein [Pseudotabrizicola sp.]
MRLFLTALCFAIIPLLSGGQAHATCTGTNLLSQMAPEDRSRLEQAAARHPFHQGNLWRATKGDQHVTLVGTYHLSDPRHDQVVAAITPYLDTATTLLVEAGPDEETALLAEVARDPTLFIMPDTTLPTLMDPEEWQTLSDAMSRRGIPGFMAAKFQPWYITVLLAVPPCMMADMQAQAKTGLDHLIMQEAKARGMPVQGLEAFDTVFTLFDGFSREDQISMLRASLAIEDQAEDYITTLADSYFAGESRLIWELMRDLSLRMPGYTPEQVDADLAKMEQALLVTRNMGWIPIIEQAAADGPVVAAFGALHLPGEYGIPYLLQQNGWALTPLTP